MKNKINSNFIKEKVLSSKKFKYGSSSVIFSAVFVVFILLINLVLSFADSKLGGLYVDMTSKKLYGITDASRQALGDVTLPVEIVFARPSDIIQGNEYSNQVRLLAENFEKEFDNVSVIYKDVITEPAYFNTFKTTSADVINDSSVIVHCPSTSRSVIYSLDNMYKYSSSTGNVFAFDGENKFATAILKVARNKDTLLKAGFIIGHNENNSDVLKHFLEDYGYEVSNVDLKTTTAKQLSEYNILVVIDPQTDFLGREAQTNNEIELLRDYVKEDFGNIMFFMNANAIDMPELCALLEDGFGVKLNTRSYVAESNENQSSYGNGIYFYGTFSDENSGAGYELHKKISASSGVYPYFAYVPSIEIVTPESGNMAVSPVVVTSDKAKLVEADTVRDWKSKPVMTLTKFTKIANNNEISAHVIVCPETGFLQGLEVSTLANADLLKNILVTMGNSNIIPDIEFKVLDESEITVTSAVQMSMMKRLAIIVPAIIAVIGVFVFIKRKYL